MSVPKATTLTTTLTKAVGSDDTEVVLGSVAGITVGGLPVDGSVLVIGTELIQVIRSDDLRVHVRRGVGGSTAAPHAVSVVVVGGPASEFGVIDGRPYRSGYDGVLGKRALMRYPRLGIYVDPNTGYEYRLCRCGPQTALSKNDWVQIDNAGLASRSSSVSRGSIGIAIEDVNIGAYCWILVSGEYLTASCADALAVASVLAFDDAVAGMADTWDGSADTVRIHRAGVTVDAIAANTGGVHIHHPYAHGVGETP